MPKTVFGMLNILELQFLVDDLDDFLELSMFLTASLFEMHYLIK